ncbi:MAG: hypothetical protein LUD00_11585 [Prevotellaceae bacterium]|nr:hypothetical protein [Prevotellaceae bacterium]
MKQHTIDLLNRWRELKPQRDAVKDWLSRKFSIEFNYNSNHIEGNTLTYGQTEILLLFGRVVGEAKMFDLEEMKAHNVGLKMVLSEASADNPLTETFIRQTHKILLREDYEVYRNLPGVSLLHIRSMQDAIRLAPILSSLLQESGLNMPARRKHRD